jgi:hypothetical protein
LAHWEQNPVWRNRYILRRTKLKLFKTVVKPVLLYGYGTWTMNDTVRNTLQTFVNGFLRKIFSIFSPRTLRNIALWEVAGEDPNEKQIKRQNWRWIGHTLRKEGYSIERQTLEWKPPEGGGKPIGTCREVF